VKDRPKRGRFVGFGHKNKSSGKEGILRGERATTAGHQGGGGGTEKGLETRGNRITEGAKPKKKRRNRNQGPGTRVSGAGKKKRTPPPLKGV